MFLSLHALQGRIQDFGLAGTLAGGRPMGDGSPPAGSIRCGAWGSKAKPPEAEECYVMRLKTTYGERNKSIQTDILWQYHNYHHLIHSSFNVSSHFCLKIQNTVCGLQNQRNGPRWQPGLIKRVSWKEHYRNVRKLVKYTTMQYYVSKKILGVLGERVRCAPLLRDPPLYTSLYPRNQFPIYPSNQLAHERYMPYAHAHCSKHLTLCHRADADSCVCTGGSSRS